MLDLLRKMTVAGEAMVVTYAPQANNRVELLIQPRLGDDPDAVTDEDARKARAALARPVRFVGSHTDVVAALDRYVAGVADDRHSLAGSYAALQAQTKEAAKQAASARAGKGATKAAPATASATALPTPAAATTEAAAPATPVDTAPAAQPDSLFG